MKPAQPLRGLSLVVEAHKWRGVWTGSDLFLRYLVLGWLTVGGSRFALSDALRLLRRKLQVIKDQNP